MGGEINESTVPTSNITKVQPSDDAPMYFRALLICIYVVSLLGGTVGIVLISFILKRYKNKLSITNISIINLVVAHSMFLVTIPFRIDYFATNHWRYHFSFCKLVSIAVHTHLYISFFFYVAILVVRFLPLFGRQPWDFQRPLIAFLSSALVWIIFSVTIFPPLWVKYGQLNEYDDEKCFNFQMDLKDNAITINIIIAAVVVVVSCTALGIQLSVLIKMVRANHCNLMSQQEFRAQLKNLRFLFIVVICFLPYHIFRIYYVLHMDPALIKQNEIYLAITTLCCLDLLTFVAIKR